MWAQVVRVFLILLISCGILAIPILPFSDQEGRDDATYRLPNNTRPITYDITITTNIDKEDLKFTGVVVIDIQAMASTSSIHLHTRQLKVNSIALWVAHDPSVQYNTDFSYDDRTEILSIDVQGVLFAGAIFRLTLNYEGTIRSDGGGFYRQSYINSANQTKYLATTQFEPTNARHAFPCYDEPQIKAIFKISIKHGRSYEAISNMPVLGGLVNK